MNYSIRMSYLVRINYSIRMGYLIRIRIGYCVRMNYLIRMVLLGKNGNPILRMPTQFPSFLSAIWKRCVFIVVMFALSRVILDLSMIIIHF